MMPIYTKATFKHKGVQYAFGLSRKYSTPTLIDEDRNLVYQFDTSLCVEDSRNNLIGRIIVNHDTGCYGFWSNECKLETGIKCLKFDSRKLQEVQIFVCKWILENDANQHN